MDEDPGKEIEVDLDLDPGRKLNRILIRLNTVDPGGSVHKPMLTYIVIVENCA